MPSWEHNRKLWLDGKLFERFQIGAIALQKALEEKIHDPEVFFKISDHLDSVMVAYEGQYESIKDPLFFWVFSTVNALYLLSGGQDMVDSRIRYILNGYREGFNKHSRYPSYPQKLIDLAFDFMTPFADEEYDRWINENRDKIEALQE